MTQRHGAVQRETGETTVQVHIDLDGAGRYEIRTGNGTLDHLLAQLSRHGLMDITIEAQGDLDTGWHHLVEDVAIALGRALHQAVGDGRGIVRMGHALVPLDETLAEVVVDLSGRGYAVVDTALTGDTVETLPGDLVRHVLESLALEARMTLHARVLYGVNAHHKAEALFKALARALRDAVQVDPRLGGEAPSTKGTLG